MRGSSASAAHKAAFSACLVTDIGGLNDKSFNHLAFVGLQTAEKNGIKGRVIQSHSPADYIPNLQACVRTGAGVTIGVGFLMTDAMDAVASSFPSNKFAIVDVDVTGMKHKPKNVEGLLFKEQEAGYLVGYAAGLWAKSKGATAIGSVGGLKIPPVDRYIAGYQFAAKKADPGLKIPPVDRYIAGYQFAAKKADPGLKTLNDYSQDFVVQAKCKEKALNQIAQGSVVEFQVAGQCGLGVLDAARSKKIFSIGVDADQGYLGSHVLTSALKKVDVSVFSAISSAKAGRLKGGKDVIFDAKVNGVGYGKWSSKAPAAIKAAVAAQFKLLKAGKIKGIPAVVK
jgi:basic membrane protein A